MPYLLKHIESDPASIGTDVKETLEKRSASP